MASNWSPHSAALKRRQRKSAGDASKIMGALGVLDMDSDEEVDFLKLALEKDNNKPIRKGKKKGKKRSTSPNDRRSKSPVKKSPVKKSPVKSRSMSPTEKLRFNKKLQEQNGGATGLSQDDIPPAIAEKLSIIANPETKMKDRIALEVEMRRNPEEEPYLAEFRDKFDRKRFLAAKDEKDKQEEEEMAKFFSEEERRKQKELEELAAAKQKELDEIKAKQDREERMKEEVRLHQAKILVSDAEETRKHAEKMLIGVTEKLALAEMEEKERQQHIQEYMEENKDASHVDKVLTKAAMEQKDTVN